MSEIAPATKITNLSAEKFNVASIRGKIAKSKKLPKGSYATRFILPAADEYSSAQTVEIYSDAKLGDADEVITVKVAIGGYYKRENNKSTGEVMEFTHNVFRAVE